MRILLVEDERAVARFLERGLRAHGLQVIHAPTGDDGVALSADPAVELVILDISLPGLDGHQVLQQIRKARPTLPVLMLTARDDLQSKVRALDGGADDYLTKPFAFEELLARLRALSRRAHQVTASSLEAGDLKVDLLTRRVRRGHRAVELSAREFALLEYFLRHEGQVLSREQILSAVWQYDFSPESNVIDVYVRYLRQKLTGPGERSLIATVRGVGYRFEAADDPELPSEQGRPAPD